jgi:hypothetical protein
MSRSQPYVHKLLTLYLAVPQIYLLRRQKVQNSTDSGELVSSCPSLVSSRREES